MPDVLHKSNATKSVNPSPLQCDHCGDLCPPNHPIAEEKHFCCHGCQTVYSILQHHDLGHFYQLADSITRPKSKPSNYAWLDNASLADPLIAFSQGTTNTIFLSLPDIHCSACIFLLENLHQIDHAIIHSQVNFLEKFCTIVYDSERISLKSLAILLDRIGYPPWFNAAHKKEVKKQSKLPIKIAVAGFSFGNIMLLSFPEYLGMSENVFFHQFGILSLVLSLPVLLYSASDFMIDAYRSIRSGRIGIDIPIALGATALFLRSAYEILSGTGMGYLDSFAGFVFFLLIGRWFQEYTYQNISFDRDYRDFLPLYIGKKEGKKWKPTKIDLIQPKDIILIKTNEVLPCDGIIIKGNTSIDYSFISGESSPVLVSKGDAVSAGGKILSNSIEIEVSSAINGSQLSQLWQADVFSQTSQPVALKLLNAIGNYFTKIIIGIALMTLVYWYITDPSKAFLAFTSVLIIACPCVLALSFPFIYGNAIRLFSKAQVFVKNAQSFYALDQIDRIVFDKTGTLSDPSNLIAVYNGSPMLPWQSGMLKSTVHYSHHPLSNAISNHHKNQASQVLDQFEEIMGYGLKSTLDGHTLRLGSERFILNTDVHHNGQVLIEFDQKVIGYYTFKSPWRPQIQKVLKSLSSNHTLSVLSGDDAAHQEETAALFPNKTRIKFGQDPQQKLAHIKNMQKENQRVLMIGDGLNDAGAFRQSDVSMVLSKDDYHFTPAADIILASQHFKNIPKLLKAARQLKYVLYGAFVLAFIYNVVGLFFAVAGQLSPLVAAILMPISSLSIVAYGLISSTLIYRHFLAD